MNTLILMLALVGSPIMVDGPLGTCYGTIVAPAQALVTEGTCALDAGCVALLEGDSAGECFGTVTGARELESGRVIVTFEAAP